MQTRLDLDVFAEVEDNLHQLTRFDGFSVIQHTARVFVYLTDTERHIEFNHTKGTGVFNWTKPLSDPQLIATPEKSARQEYNQQMQRHILKIIQFAALWPERKDDPPNWIKQDNCYGLKDLWADFFNWLEAEPARATQPEPALEPTFEEVLKDAQQLEAATV